MAPHRAPESPRLEQQWQNTENSRFGGLLGTGKHNLEIKEAGLDKAPSPIPTLLCNEMHGHFFRRSPTLYQGHLLPPHHLVSQLRPTPSSLFVDVTPSKEPSLNPQAWVSVFKCGFYYYSGMIRSTGQETSGIEDSLLLTVPQRRGYVCHTGSHREAQGWSGDRGARGRCG